MNAAALLGMILRHDRKITSYKIALIRSLNDFVLGFDHLRKDGCSLAIPLRSLAEFWMAYYWPFVSAINPIQQGMIMGNNQDISFRPALSRLRTAWEQVTGGNSFPSDGFYLMAEFQSFQRRSSYNPEFNAKYNQAVRDIADAILQPIRHTGQGHPYSVFSPPAALKKLQASIPQLISIPGTNPNERCMVIAPELWSSFYALSPRIESVCIQEWCLFTEKMTGLSRNLVYSLLSNRPTNRRPLTWEHNQVKILMLEGKEFECPWSGKKLWPHNFEISQLLPLRIYPINECWNLLPGDADIFEQRRQERIPELDWLQSVLPRLINTYQNYLCSPALQESLRQDARLRFNLGVEAEDFPTELATSVTQLIFILAAARRLVF